MALVTGATLAGKYIVPAVASAITTHFLSGSVEGEFDKPPHGPPGMPRDLMRPIAPTSGGVQYPYSLPVGGGVYLEEDQRFAPRKVKQKILNRPMAPDYPY